MADMETSKTYAIDNLRTGITYIGKVTETREDGFSMEDVVTILTIEIAKGINENRRNSYESTARALHYSLRKEKKVIFNKLENMAIHEISIE